MTRKWIKRITWIVTTPVVLFAMLIVLLYVPPIQNFICRKVTASVSESMDMQISIRRIDLRFPARLLVRGVEVIQEADTLLSLESMHVGVQVMPLMRGKVELDDFTLRNLSLNTLDLIEEVSVCGRLGYFTLKSHGVDLVGETAIINGIELENTHLLLSLREIETPKDTAETEVNWQVLLQKLTLNNVSLGVQMPVDTLFLSTYLGAVSLLNVEADLGAQFYGLERLQIEGSSLSYDLGTSPVAEGFDPSHIALQDIRIGIDSIRSRGREMQAVIREFSMNERSGLNFVSATGSVKADSVSIQLPDFRLNTMHSEVRAHALASWDLIDTKEGLLEANLSVKIGKQDLFLIGGDLSPDFKLKFPTEPFTLALDASGNLSELRIPRIAAELPGAFSIKGDGVLFQLTDSVRRLGNVELQMQTENLNFLSELAVADSSLVIPSGISLDLKAGVKGSLYTTALHAKESEGSLRLEGEFDGATEVYKASIQVDSLQVMHFLPKDSIGLLVVNGSVSGKGLDFSSPRSSAQATIALDQLQYGKYQVSGLTLDGGLANSIASAHLKSNNVLLAGEIEASYALNRSYTDATVRADIKEVNLYELGVVETPMPRPVSLDMEARLMKDSVRLLMHAGDLRLSFRGRGSLEGLMQESEGFSDLLLKQIENKHLDHVELRQALPSASLSVRSGKENPLADYLRITNNVKYETMNVGFVATPRVGINGRASLHTLKIDTLQLDTVYFATHQDTARLRLWAGVNNGPENPQFVFRSSITGEIRTEDAELTLKFVDADGDTGVLLGLNARPRRDGLRFSLTPDEPIIAYRRFQLKEHNRAFLKPDLSLLVDVEMLDSAGMGLRVHSVPDTLSLQNLDIELRRINLEEISQVMPYFPALSGLFSLEANYQRKSESMQVSAEAVIQDFLYEGSRIGDVGLGATWLPSGDTQYIDAYLRNDQEEVLTLNGSYDMKQEMIDANATLEHFPLHLANVFMSAELLKLDGDMDGSLSISGSTTQPQMDGEIIMDRVTLESVNYGVRFKLDERPLRVSNSRLVFDKYAIYSLVATDNPFTVDGYIDFADLNKTHADLKLLARNYPLMNAKRERGSELYGKVNVDLISTVRGPLDGLVMRGNLNLLANTDVTYILRDSPLTVQDRLGDLVEFTSFAADTIPEEEEEDRVISWGGLDMMLAINIDPAVKVRVDLSEDRSSYIALEGGGTLSFQYTPEGVMSLTGRYAFSGGSIRYSLPVIPLKEFKIREGSYVEWAGNPMDPNLNIKAVERVRASISNGDGSSRIVGFDASINVKNRLENLELSFNLEAPEDMEIQQELAAMDAEERGKQAITLMATGMYLGHGTGNLNMGAALNNVLQSQISSIAGSALKTVNLSFGVESHANASGNTRTDYSFRYAQRFFNDRVQVVIGGSISSGENDANQDESFIDNVSLEYRLDSSSTRYLRLYHNKNYESLLEGEVMETGVGLVLRKKVNRLGELFIFRRKKE